MQKESKRERFIRVAEARTNKILDLMKLLGNCAAPNNYDYTEEDIKNIFDTLEKEMKHAKSKFLGTNNKNVRFSLKRGD